MCTDPGGMDEPIGLDEAIEHVVQAHTALRRAKFETAEPKQVAFESAVLGLLNVLGRREQPAARTPEAVLRAMLKAYEQALLDACLAATLDRASAVGARAPLLHRQCNVIRGEVAWAVAGRTAPVNFADPSEEFYRQSSLFMDYQARLNGTRPLNAPPSEV